MTAVPLTARAANRMLVFRFLSFVSFVEKSDTRVKVFISSTLVTLGITGSVEAVMVAV